jgi:hypothetical protein
MNPKIPKCFCCLCLVIFLFSLSCTSTINLSAGDFQNRTPDGTFLYRVTTTDDLRYEFKQYSISGDTLFLAKPFSPDTHDRKRHVEEVTLPFDTIESIQHIRWDTKKSLYAAGIATVTVTGLILLMATLGAPLSGL